MLRRLLQLRPGEFAPVALLFSWYFCVIGAAFVGRAVRDALFLAHLGAGRLPVMYIVSPLVLTAAGLTYARIEGKLRRDRLVIGTAIIGGLALLGARALLATGAWIFYALYVGVGVLSGFVIMQLWTVASDRFTSRDGKRLFGVIGAGGTIADIAIGAVLSVLAPRIGAENLLYVAAALLFGAAGFALALRSISGGQLDSRRRSSGRESLRPAGPAARAETTKQSRAGASHLGSVAVALVCAVIVVTLVEFQFKAVTAASFGDDRAGMVRYFGNMSIATGVVSLVIQIVATRWALQRLGVVGALMILPIVLAGGELGLLLAPGLIAATMLKMSDETVRYTVNDAATQLLFLPVPSRVRGGWKAVIDSVWRPGAQVVLGLGLVSYRALAPGRMAPLVVAAFAVIAVWLVLLVRLRAEYVRALRETLRKRPVGLSETAVTHEEVSALYDALERSDDVEPGKRDATIRALARAARLTMIAPEPARLRAAIDRELAGAYRAMAAADGLGRAESRALPDGTRVAPPFLPGAPEGAAALMSKTLRDRQDRARDRVLGLLAALYPAADLETIHTNLGEPDPARRANATEVLDGLLERGLRARVLPLIDDSPRYAKLASVTPMFDLPELAPADWIAELLADRSPWMVACAAYYAGVHGITAVVGRLQELTRHDDAVVREAAFATLTHLLEASRVRALAATLVADPFAPLAARAAEVTRS